MFSGNSNLFRENGNDFEFEFNMPTPPVNVSGTVTVPLYDLNSNDSSPSLGWDQDLIDYYRCLDYDVPVNLDPIYPNDGTVLSEAICVSASQESTLAAPNPGFLPIKLDEIKLEDPVNPSDWLSVPIRMEEIKIEEPVSPPDLMIAERIVYGEDIYFGGSATPDPTMPVLFQAPPPPLPEITKKKRVRSPRKQKLNANDLVGEVVLHPQQMPETPTPTTSQNALNFPLKTETNGIKSKKPAKRLKDKKIAAKTKLGQKGDQGRKKPLYMKSKCECSTNAEWIQVKRAKNTKVFHERTKARNAASLEFWYLVFSGTPLSINIPLMKKHFPKLFRTIKKLFPVMVNQQESFLMM